MQARRRAKAATRQDTYYQPSWVAALLALIAAILLSWQGMAHADGFRPEASPVHTLRYE